MFSKHSSPNSNGTTYQDFRERTERESSQNPEKKAAEVTVQHIDIADWAAQFMDAVMKFKDVAERTKNLMVLEELTQRLPKTFEYLNFFLEKPCVKVKKIILKASIHLYSISILLLCNAKNKELVEATWASMTQLKKKIFLLLRCNNEGLHALTVKFMETVVISQTFKDQYKSKVLSLNDIPIILKIFRPRKLEDEAKAVFFKMIEFHGAPHISSFNLMVYMQVLTIIAKKRFEFFSKTLQAFESLHANLPPTLSQSQVISVRKNLKLHLFILVKHPGAIEFHSRISIMLSDLGATPQQIARCFPNLDLSKKRSMAKEEILSKRARSQEAIKSDSSRSKTACRNLKAKETSIDITAEDLVPKLNIDNVDFKARKEGTDEADESSLKQIHTDVDSVNEQKPKKQAFVLMPSGSQSEQSQSKKLDLTNNTPLSTDEGAKVTPCDYNTFLNANKCLDKIYDASTKAKFLITLATQYRGDLALHLINYILENPRARIDMAFSWFDLEYAAYQGTDGSPEGNIENYEEVLHRIYVGVMAGDDCDYYLYSRFFSDVPFVTDDMGVSLKIICSSTKTASEGFEIAKNMTLKRRNQKLLFLNIILQLTLHEESFIRNKAVHTAWELHEIGHCQSLIEKFALKSIKFMCKATPPLEDLSLFSQPPLHWSDKLTKVCLDLYLVLLPINHCLIHDLGTVYAQTSADIKRIILQSLECPVKRMTAGSAELLRFTKSCPKGAETFRSRIIQILFE